MRERRIRIGILVLLAVLPALIPFGEQEDRYFYVVPSFIDTTDGTFLPWLLMGALLWVAVTWSVLGYFFARWFGRSKKGILLCNVPVIANALFEIVYYIVLGRKGADHPALAYWIGSHIDKIKPLRFLSGSESVLVAIAISVLYYFIFFWIGYRAGISSGDQTSFPETE